MRDVWTVDHPGDRQLPRLIKAFEEADAVTDDQWDDMQLQLIDKSSRQALPGNGGAAPNCRVAFAGCFLRGIDRRCDRR